jgi:hypothetical protein
MSLSAPRRDRVRIKEGYEGIVLSAVMLAIALALIIGLRLLVE